MRRGNLGNKNRWQDPKTPSLLRENRGPEASRANDLASVAVIIACDLLEEETSLLMEVASSYDQHPPVVWAESEFRNHRGQFRNRVVALIQELDVRAHEEECLQAPGFWLAAASQGLRPQPIRVKSDGDVIVLFGCCEPVLRDIVPRSRQLVLASCRRCRSHFFPVDRVSQRPACVLLDEEISRSNSIELTVSDIRHFDGTAVGSRIEPGEAAGVE